MQPPVPLVVPVDHIMWHLSMPRGWSTAANLLLRDGKLKGGDILALEAKRIMLL